MLSEDGYSALATEVTVLATQATLEGLAERIERAYRLRRSGWYRSCTSSGVWSTAAALLVQIHQDDPSIPIDPELYVAVQPVNTAFEDPWMGLTQPAAVSRYRARIKEMVRKLQKELRVEVRTAEKMIRRGETIRVVLQPRSAYLSPLGCYIVAQRAGLPELAERFRTAAISQHRSCPLYRVASEKLLDPELYPARGRAGDDERVARLRHLSTETHLN